jgi:hypothetical protein
VVVPEKVSTPLKHSSSGSKISSSSGNNNPTARKSSLDAYSKEELDKIIAEFQVIEFQMRLYPPKS